MNNLVKYNNNLNDIALKGLTSIEINIFFAICSKAKNTDGPAVISFTDLKSMSGFSQNTSKLVAEIVQTNKKLLACSCTVANGPRIQQFTLFDEFITDTETQLLTVSLHSKFKYLLNNLIGNFTQFELRESIHIKSVYAKRAYTLLKQYRTTGVMRISIDKFRTILCVPECYSMSNFTASVLEPIMKELPAIFSNLKLKKIKENKKIKTLEFYFTPEKKVNQPTKARWNMI